MAKLQLIRKHDIIERFMHWVHLVNMILLVLSGLQIHFPAFNVFGSMSTARFVHFVDMYVFFFVGVFHVYQFFATGKWNSAGPTPRNMAGTGAVIKYYLFMADTKPEYGKYNPMQIITYFLLFAVSAVMAVVGFALYWPVQLAVVVNAFGGLMTLRQVHYILSWVFISFSIVHVYLILTQPLKYTKAMVTGHYWKRAGG
ncbi:MAG: cytochrome b/b6 domain-containing protein [Actinobacteria bacterium]|nr:cytochrome b/b6 domain-containing protein [Actinomycetota bacterium]